MRLAQRTRHIDPFYVMEVAKAAQQLAAQAEPGAPEMIYLNIGEPDFTAPPLVQQAAARAIAQGQSQYTPATGLPQLRARISAWYRQRFGVEVDAARIIVTAGASAALQLACLALINPGDAVLMPDPSYPCNRHFVRAADGIPRLLPCGPAQRFQPNVQQIQEHWSPDARGALLASPSNPTGTSIPLSELERIVRFLRGVDGFLLVDEIYLGLSHDAAYGQTALSLGEDIISINSFSKYFNMTGWRLGWLVVPPDLLDVVERLAQNLYICPSALAQHAALACFEPESLAIYEERRALFRRRRDAFIPGLNALGLTVPVLPDGAFYAWADCSAACARLGVADSWDLSFALMQRARVAVTPGRDFGAADTARYLRFSTANSLQQLQTALQRLGDVLA